jgi:hypothetical protein
MICRLRIGRVMQTEIRLGQGVLGGGGGGGQSSELIYDDSR